MVFRLNDLGKKNIGFCLIGLGKFFIPISPRYAKKVQAPPVKQYQWNQTIFINYWPGYNSGPISNLLWKLFKNRGNSSRGQYHKFFLPIKKSNNKPARNEKSISRVFYYIKKIFFFKILKSMPKWWTHTKNWKFWILGRLGDKGITLLCIFYQWHDAPKLQSCITY